MWVGHPHAMFYVVQEWKQMGGVGSVGSGNVGGMR